MATIKDLAEQYGLEDYEQLLGGYPNATKFVNALQSNIESHIPTTEDLQSPERMGKWSLAAALNQPTGLTFIGKNARNWDAQAAKLAEEKLNAGADPAEVWREHLIGRMPDKTLFSEISDYPASFKGVGSFGDVVMNRLDALQNAGKKTIDDPMNVADIFTHRDLVESYPELFPSTEVRFLSKDDKSKGSMQVMDDGTNILKMPYDATRDKTSTMLHELQHAIQRQEGWGKGSNPLTSQRDYYNFLEKKFKDINGSSILNKFNELSGKAEPYYRIKQIQDLQNISQPRQLFNSSDYYKYSRELRDLLGPPPKYGSKLPWAQDAGNIIAKKIKDELTWNGKDLLESIGNDRDFAKKMIRSIEGKQNRIGYDKYADAYKTSQEIQRTDPRFKDLSNEEKMQLFKLTTKLNHLLG